MITLMLQALIQVAEFDVLKEEAVIEAKRTSQKVDMELFHNIKYRRKNGILIGEDYPVIEVSFCTDRTVNVFIKRMLKRDFHNAEIAKRFVLASKALAELWRSGYSERELKIRVWTDFPRGSGKCEVSVFPWPYVPDVERNFVFDRSGNLLRP
jgi:hypothetical protein